jgi:hypothetical protein
LIDGQKSGYVKSTRLIYGDRVETEVTTDMEMRRGGETLPIVTVSAMTETLEGAPLKISKTTRGAGMSQTVTGTITPGGTLRLTTESAGQISSRTVDWPKGALMNEGQRLESMRYGLKEGTAYASKYFDPDLLEPIDVEILVGARSNLDLFGLIVTGTKINFKMVFRGNSSEQILYVDDEMNTLKTESTQMGMKVEMIACTEPYALSENNPQEMIQAAFIDAPGKLSKQKRQKPITVTVRLSNEAAGLRIVSTDEQVATTKGDKQIVTVSKLLPPLGAKMPYIGDDADAIDALAPNPWVQSDSEEIKKLARTAVADAKDAAGAAYNIERFVGDYIEEKSFSVGYASALETARSKQGDCTEHAVLTAALCRASGIPAQIVFGLVYIEQFEDQKDLFGGHAWTRVYLDGKWLSLDAALGGFDTGHIALGISNGDPTDFFEIIDVIGNLEIVSMK